MKLMVRSLLQFFFCRIKSDRLHDNEPIYNPIHMGSSKELDALDDSNIRL